MSKKIYIAGPMTSIPYFNFPTFDTYRDLYEKFGYEVFSPADHDRRLLGREDGWIPSEFDMVNEWKAWSPNAVPTLSTKLPTLRDMLGADLNWIAKHATHIAMIPGWEKSAGANAEWNLAKALGLTIHYYPMPLEMINQIRKEQGKTI